MVSITSNLELAGDMYTIYTERGFLSAALLHATLKHRNAKINKTGMAFAEATALATPRLVADSRALVDG